MSEQEVTVPTVETIETPASVEGGGEPSVEHGAAPVESQPAAYTPNFKFKVYDEEKEIPESYRALIKDAATEKEVRDLFEKAHGLDGLKPVHQKAIKERDELSTRFKETEGHLNSTVENLKKIHAYSQNDLDTFFQIYKIPQERLFQYVTGKLQESELPPERVSELNAGRQAKLEADYYKEQYERQQESSRQSFRQSHESGMTQEMSRPEVAQLAKQVEERTGQTGAFLKHVNDYGNHVYQTQNGRYVSPQEAVAQTFQYYQKLLNNNPPQQAPVQTAPNEPPPPPIPNVGSGKSVSPVKPRFKSLDQLKKHVAEITQEA